MEKEYTLSKNAIKYLENLKIENKTSFSIQSITIKTNFIFQIESVKYYKKFIYDATLFDSSAKSSHFSLIFDKSEDIPQKGDLINVGEIKKLYNKKNNIFIYDCKRISFIERQKDFLVDISKLKNYDNKIMDDKIKFNLEKAGKNHNIHCNNGEGGEEEEEENKEEEEDEEEEDEEKAKKEEKIENNINNENNIHKDIFNRNILNLKESNFEDMKTNSQSCNNFLLISELDSNKQFFSMYLKCIKKEEIKECRYKFKNLQNYLFSDMNNDKIEGISFDPISEKLDAILQINEIYLFSNCNLILNNKSYRQTNMDFKLILNRYTKIQAITNNEIKNKFINHKENIINNENNTFITISNIININQFEIINVFAFVLKDEGSLSIPYEYNKEYKGRILLLGDDSNYKISIIFWHPSDINEKYNPGDLLYIQNCKVNEYHNLKNLYGTKYRKISNSFNPENDSRLKKYYSTHQDINKYLEPRIKKSIYQNYNLKDKTFVEPILIQDIQKICGNKEYKNRLNFKISAYVKKILHSNRNYYYGCKTCRKKMMGDICQNCGGNSKILIIHFSLKIVDSTSSIWILMFGEIGESFLGIKAEEYKNIIDKGINNQNSELNLLNQKVENKQYIFIGYTQHYVYNEKEGYRFHIKYYNKKNKREYNRLTQYLKSFLK